MIYNHYITEEDEVLILMDAEIYDRTTFHELFHQYLIAIEPYGGILIFDGSVSEAVVGDYRPRTTLFILKWNSSEAFYRWQNSSQNFRKKQDFQECSDLKMTLVAQNKKNQFQPISR